MTAVRRLATSNGVARLGMGITVFTPAPMPPGESRRSEAVSQSGLLDRVADPALTRIAKDARRGLCSAWCGVTVMVGDMQHVIASSGGMIGMYRRSTSLSSYVIAAPNEPFVILDASIDERFAGNPFISDGLIRFYAGTAIRDGAGVAIGVLCVTDKIAHAEFTHGDASLLREFANGVSATL